MSTAALVVIDVQTGFDDARWGARNNPAAEDAMARALELWRRAGLPVIHVQHLSTEEDSPLRPDRPGSAFKPLARPRSGEAVVTKSVNCAFIGTDLAGRLERAGIDTLVLMGFTTDHCVSTTARMAGDLGYRTFVLSDATATFERTAPGGRHVDAETMHETALASLDGEFARVVDVAELERIVEALAGAAP